MNGTAAVPGTGGRYDAERRTDGGQAHGGTN